MGPHPPPNKLNKTWYVPAIRTTTKSQRRLTNDNYPITRDIKRQDQDQGRSWGGRGGKFPPYKIQLKGGGEAPLPDFFSFYGESKYVLTFIFPGKGGGKSAPPPLFFLFDASLSTLNCHFYWQRW